ncbi:hypothetical protein [Streptomyces erythrochromogenes]|uniref:hypothetical protein n=1 Tax=Streptomyces erythrochromogenes TaxID=285574 RepID=UPI0033CCA4B7
MTSEPPGRLTATAPWGPVAWSYTADDAAETARVAAQLVTSSTSSWPSDAPIRLDVRATRDREALDRLERAASGPVGRLREEKYRRTPDGTWVRCADRPADAEEPGLPRHAVGHRGGRWTIVHDDDADAQQRAKFGEIVLRALVAAALAGLGGLTVHASAATGPDGRTAVFLGDSGAGKSTLALALARAGGRFVSGDRTLLVPGPGGWWAVGAGLLPRYRWGTLEGLGLAERVREAALLRHGGGRHRVADLPRPPAKLVFTPAESERVLDVRTADCAPLDRLVVLLPTSGEGPAGRPLTSDAAAAAVRAHLLPSDAGCLSWPSPGRPTGAGDVDALVRVVARSALAWNPVRHQAEEALSRVRAATPGAARSGHRPTAP